MDPWFWVQCVILRDLLCTVTGEGVHIPEEKMLQTKRKAASVSWHCTQWSREMLVISGLAFHVCEAHGILIIIIMDLHTEWSDCTTLYFVCNKTVSWSNVKEMKLTFEFLRPVILCVQMCRGRAARAEPSSRVVPVRSGPSGRTSITPSRLGSSTHTPTPARQKSSR